MDCPDFLPEDWRPHVGVVTDGIRLVVRGEHFPQVAFLYEAGDERDAVHATVEAKQGRPYLAVAERARAELLERAARRARKSL